MEIVVLELHSLSVLHFYKYCSLVKTHIDSMYKKCENFKPRHIKTTPLTTVDASKINT